MKRPLFILTALLLASCVREAKPLEIETIPITREVSQGSVTCKVDGKYPNIKRTVFGQAIGSINSLVAKEIVGSYTTDIRSCPELYLDLIESGSTLTETTGFDYVIELNENNLLSISHSASHYLEGAAHPTNVLGAMTIDVDSGDKYRIWHLFGMNVPHREYLEIIVDKKLDEEGLVSSTDVKTDFTEWVFFLRPNALVFGNLFDIHALKGVQVEIPLEDLRDIAAKNGPLMRLLEATPST